MLIDFVNHAAFGIRSGGVHLLCDPWLESRIFNEGWDPLVPSSFKPEDFASVTHIWFSHEHPDHFHPQTLQSIPEPQRARITVLYQETRDRRVVGYCRSLGFADVRELEAGTWFDLEPGFSISCRGMRPADSWLCVRTPGATLLNLNDCELHAEEACNAVAREVGDVDVLMTQFSVSAWGGGEGELARRRAGLDRLLQRIDQQCESIEPCYVIPFASFIWFCHRENFWMNEMHNRIEDVCDRIARRPDCHPVVLRPGDRWEVGQPHDPDPGIRFWSAARESVRERSPVTCESVTADALLEAAGGYCERLRHSAGALRLRMRDAVKTFRRARRGDGPHRSPAIAWLRLATLRADPSLIWIHDLARGFAFDLSWGRRSADVPRETCDIALSSDSLLYCFQFLWGGDTLQINGRFLELAPDARLHLFQDFWMAKGFNAGDTLSWGDSVRRKALGLSARLARGSQ